MSIGSNIRAFRESMRMTRSDFAKMIGSTRRFVKMWEDGDIKPSRRIEKQIVSIIAAKCNMPLVPIVEESNDEEEDVKLPSVDYEMDCILSELGRANCLDYDEDNRDVDDSVDGDIVDNTITGVGFGGSNCVDDNVNCEGLGRFATNTGGNSKESVDVDSDDEIRVASNVDMCGGVDEGKDTNSIHCDVVDGDRGPNDVSLGNKGGGSERSNELRNSDEYFRGYFKGKAEGYSEGRQDVIYEMCLSFGVENTSKCTGYSIESLKYLMECHESYKNCM